MKTIEIDDDVYQHLVQNTKDIGEQATSILRRLLGLPQNAPTPTAPTAPPAVGAHELSDLLAQAAFHTSTTAVARMLKIFKEAHKQKGPDFAKVLQLQGRDRKYFAKSRQEISKSGKSTQPHEIPGTGYWVMTNSPTPQKQRMVQDVLKILGYSDEAIKDAVAVIN